jgi:DNA-binding IclR family transcriptional regulator
MTLTRRSLRTITSATALDDQLEDVASEGLAVEDEELLEGSCAIAAPVRDESGDVTAAVGLVACGGHVDAEEIVERYEGPVLATARRVSRRIGWREDEE